MESQPPIFGVMKGCHVSGCQSFSNPLNVFLFSQNQLSAKFRALRHEHLVATRAKPKPDLRSQRWICIFSKPCAKRMNVTQKRYEPPPPLLYRHYSHHTNILLSGSTYCVPFLVCIWPHLPSNCICR